MQKQPRGLFLTSRLAPLCFRLCFPLCFPENFPEPLLVFSPGSRDVADCVLHTKTVNVQIMAFILQVHVRVKIPSKLGDEEKKLVEKLRDIQASKHKVGPFTF